MDLEERLLVAEQNMKEFDPECERHHVILLVKAVNAGCTLEMQIENSLSGVVRRLSTTNSPKDDIEDFKKAVVEAFEEVWWQAEADKRIME